MMHNQTIPTILKSRDPQPHKKKRRREDHRWLKENEAEHNGSIDWINWSSTYLTCLLTNIHITNSMHHSWSSCSYVGFAYWRRSHFFLMLLCFSISPSVSYSFISLKFTCLCVINLLNSCNFYVSSYFCHQLNLDLRWVEGEKYWIFWAAMYFFVYW